MDVDSIGPGADFVEVIDQRLKSCSAVVAIIGRNWAGSGGSDSKPVLGDPGDFVRIEIESALKQNLFIMPVLVEGAAIPRPSSLPKSMRPLCRRNAIAIGHAHFDADSAILVQALSKILPPSESISDEKPTPEAPKRGVSTPLRGLLLKGLAV